MFFVHKAHVSADVFRHGILPYYSDKGYVAMENRGWNPGICNQREVALSPAKEGKRIGAIVMNANPFTNGHRYLVSDCICYV